MQDDEYNSRDYKIIFMLIVVGTVAELLDSLVQVINFPVPNNLVTFASIIGFFLILLKKEIQEDNESKKLLYITEKELYVKNYANIQPNERKRLKKLNKQAFFKIVVFYSLIWIAISTVFILFFASYFDKRHELSWGLILFFITLFTIIGLGIIVFGWLYEFKNAFPDIRKFLEKYGYEAIENNEGYIKNERWKALRMNHTYVKDRFIGKLKNNSFVDYRMELWIEDSIKFPNVEITKVGISINIKIDMRNVLKNNQFELAKHDEIMERFIKYFPGKEIINPKNIEYYGQGYFNITIEEFVNKEVSIDYLVAIARACQELEDTFNFRV